MNGFKCLLFAISLLINFSSCQKSIHGREELIGYINNPDNGLLKQIEIGKIKAKMLYKPWQLIKADKVGDNSYNKNQDGIMRKYFFLLSLSANNKEVLKQLPFDQYSELVQVMAFRMNEFIKVFPDKGRSIQPDECFFMQTYGLSDANRLLIVVDKSKLLGTKIINISLREFGLNTGNLIFYFNTNDIDRIPPINI